MQPIRPATIMHNVYALLPALAMQAGIKLDLFTQLSNNPMSAKALAHALKVKEDKLSPLLNALVTAGLLNLEKGEFCNTEETDRYLVNGPIRYSYHINYLIDKILNVVTETTATITNDQPQKKIDWLQRANCKQPAHTNGHYYGSVQAGVEFGAMIDLSTTRHILDLAGGSGGLAIGLCDAYPHIKITIGDLPEVVPVTRTFVEKAGMSARISVIEFDILKKPPQGWYSAVVLRSFIQTLSPDNAVKALSNIRAAMAPEGSIYIIGHFLDETCLYPQMSVLHNLLFLNLYENGRAYPESDYRKWLKTAEFTKIKSEYAAFSDGCGMITARKK